MLKCFQISAVCRFKKPPLPPLRLCIFPLLSARDLWLRQEKRRVQTSCDNRVLLFIQGLSARARWWARLMSPYSMSAEAPSPWRREHERDGLLEPICWESSTKTSECQILFPVIMAQKREDKSGLKFWEEGEAEELKTKGTMEENDFHILQNGWII